MEKNSKPNLGTIMTSLAGLLIVFNLIFLKDNGFTLFISIAAAILAIAGLVLFESERRKNKKR